MATASVTRRALAGRALAFVSWAPAGEVCAKPPRLVLRTSAGRQRGARGGYCWGTCCVDVGNVHPASVLYADPGDAPLVDYSRMGPLAELSWVVRPTRIVVVEGGLGWVDAPGTAIHEGAVAAPNGPVRLPDDLPHGLYLIDVFATAAGGGSTVQGFRLYVGDEGRSTPLPAATPIPEPGPTSPLPGPAASPSRPTRSSGPPRLVLCAASGCQVAGLGGYCWADAGCVDPSGMNWPRKPLVVAAGEVIEVRLDQFDVPVRLEWDIVRDPGQPEANSVLPNGIAAAVTHGRAVHPIAPVLISADLPPGDYLIPIAVRASGPNGGDAYQGFRMRVVAAEFAPATPVVEAG